MQQILIHERQSFFTAALERHLISTPVVVRWYPYFPDFQAHLLSTGAEVVILNRIQITDDLLDSIAELAPLTWMGIVLTVFDRQSEPILRELGVRSVLCETDPQVVMIETIKGLLQSAESRK